MVYVRLTSFGQSTSASQIAGHDMNFLALAGILNRLKPYQTGTQPAVQYVDPHKPEFPSNILGDYAAGSLASF